VPEFVRLTEEDSRTTYKHIGQFLAQVSDYGITDVHKIRLFPLSLPGTTFNWFVSLAPNSIQTWEHLEQRFHEYFYNGETELRLSHLAAVRQKHHESAAEYVRRFRETRNKCYSLTIRERDLAELAFVGLAPAMKDKMDMRDFEDVNQLLQRVVMHENRAKEGKSYGQFRETSSKEKPGVSYMEEDSVSDDDGAGVCVAERVSTASGKPLACAFLKPSPRKKDEMKFTFDVTKCDKLFNVLLQTKVIQLSEGHVVSPLGQAVKGKYCKWHDTFSHNTNDCNYFRQQLQSALNDGRLTLGDGQKMRLDTYPFPANVNVIDFEGKKVLVRPSQADTMKGEMWLYRMNLG
jgi:hypothetical protein